ncbi:MAG: hypothetical protein V2B19_05685 [Pseudomonadota bacterium]
MLEKEIVHVQQGVWIDEHLLKKAGLGARVQISFSDGEIRIQSVSVSLGEKRPSKKGWNTLRALGDDAQVGCLDNASENHDRYLYGPVLLSIVDTEDREKWDPT